MSNKGVMMLAELYGVKTKRLNEQVKRNRERFPEYFMFGLTEKEEAEVVANGDHLAKLKFSKALPYVPVLGLDSQVAFRQKPRCTG